jgi:hypothetical protein
VRDGIHPLRTTSLSVEESARLAGYRSSNKFYQRVRSYTGLRPSRIRALSKLEFERLLEERLSIRRLDGRICDARLRPAVKEDVCSMMRTRR